MAAAVPVIVRLGNPAPQIQEPILDENGAPTGRSRSVPAPHMHQSITTVDMRPGFADAADVDLALSTSNDRMLKLIARNLTVTAPGAGGAGQGTADYDHLRRYAVGVLEVEQLMQTHSGGEAPTWVACDELPEFAEALAKHFGCHNGEPTALQTTVGRDALHAQHMSTAAQPAAFNYMAVSANTTSPAAGNTTLPGEITTAGGGLVRAQATYAHTAGTNTTTLTKTFTANGSDALPVSIAKIGILNASSGGTLGYESLLTPAASTLSASGDSVAITETVTAG